MLSEQGRKFLLPRALEQERENRRARRRGALLFFTGLFLELPIVYISGSFSLRVYQEFIISLIANVPLIWGGLTYLMHTRNTVMSLTPSEQKML